MNNQNNQQLRNKRRSRQAICTVDGQVRGAGVETWNEEKNLLTSPTSESNLDTIKTHSYSEKTSQTTMSTSYRGEFGKDSRTGISSPDSRSDRLMQTSPEQEDDIASVISEVVGHAEGSVDSDVSALTDGDVFRTDFLNHSSTTGPKNYRSVFRAPEPPSVSGGRSKLTDISSETTGTTVSKSSVSRSSSHHSKKKRSVSFCEVRIRNYERILEFNPSVTSGPAVGIGWRYSVEDDENIPLDIFEDTREYHRRTSTKDLTLSRMDRENLLRNLGYTQKEIALSVRTILRLKNQRKQTIQNLHASTMEEFVEKAARKMKRVLFFGNRKVKNINTPMESRDSRRVITA
jgi:hypothetical protein